MTTAGTKTSTPQCPYCKAFAKYSATSTMIYQGREYGPVWVCVNYPRCDAYVGTHPDGSPKGILANKPLRQLKMQAHAIFDPLWQNWKAAYPDAKRCSGRIKSTMRLRAYEWLAEQMGIEVDDCHIGHFDDAKCRQAIEILRRESPSSVSIREWAKRPEVIAKWKARQLAGVA